MNEFKYSGKWKISNKDYSGDLFIVREKGIIRLVLTYKWDGGIFIEDENIPNKIEYINGTLNTEAKMTLINCKVIKRNSNFSYMKNTIVLDAEYCINGLNFSDFEDIKFFKIEFRISKTLSWSCLNGFKYLNGSTRKTPIKMRYSFNKSMKYDLDDGFKLEILPCLAPMSYNCELENINLGQYIKFRFFNKKEKKLEEFIDLLNKIKALIEIGIREHVDIIKVEAYNKKIFSIYTDAKEKEHKQFYPIEIFLNQKIESKYEEPDKTDMLFELKDITKQSIEEWYRKIQKLKPIIELYIETIEYEGMSLERKFLNIVQALETYHMRFICNEKKDFKLRVDNVYKKNKISEYIYDKEQEETPYILIKNRMLDLFFSSNILWRFDPMIKFVYFTNSTINSRHYYTHYSESKKYKALNGIELEEAYYILRELLENYILKELGIDNEKISKKLQNLLNIIKRNVEVFKNIEIDNEVAKKFDLNTSLYNISNNICYDYGLGEVKENSFIDDTDDTLNYVLRTKLDENYIVKIFNKNKKDEDCLKYIEEETNDFKLCKSRSGEKLYRLQYFAENYRICVYKKIKG